MCYHNSLKAEKKDLEKRFNATMDGENYQPIYHSNGFAFHSWPVLTCKDSSAFEFLHWGLIPFWQKDFVKAKDARKNTLNCKGETAWELPSFRASVKSKRCIIPSTGFYEWRWEDEKGKNKFPYYIYVKEQPIFSLAGIFDECTVTDAEGKDHIFKTFSIVTTEANEMMAEIHNSKKRMPVILPLEKEKLWISNELSKEEINALLLPFPSEALEAYTISKLITAKGQNTNVPEVMAPYNYETTK